MHIAIRFDYNGTSGAYQRTPQGFLRVNARLTKTGIFKYAEGREYRCDDEVFRVDSLASLKGAPITDLHPAEKGTDSFLTPSNAKQHIIGITEGVERDGAYLKGSLLIFHADAIAAIERGERQEISLGYQCRLDPTPGTINGEAYDSIQRDIVVNHVAIGPKGWGRAGPDCAIRQDSKEKNMTETIRLDGVDIALTKDSITSWLDEHRRTINELRGRLDAVGLELEKAQATNTALEDPKALEAKVQARIALMDQCKKILGDGQELSGKTDEELKLLAIKHRYPNVELANKDQIYLEGMFMAILASLAERNDSLSNARQAMVREDRASPNQAYEKWLSHSAKMWSLPLTGSLR
jgi:uncharacterized protein